MKKLYSILLALVILIATNSVRAESYTWKHHGISFDIPGNGTIQTNTENEFIVRWLNFEVYITILPKDNYSNNDIEELLDAQIPIMRLDECTDYIPVSWDGFSGVSVVGASQSLNCNVLISMLRQEKNDKILNVIIKYLPETEEQAVTVLKSIKNYEPTPTEFVWKEHGLRFRIPENGTITKNTRSEFDVYWSNLDVSIKLFDANGSQAHKPFDVLNREVALFGLDVVDSDTFEQSTLTGSFVNGNLRDGTKWCVCYMKADNRNIIVLAYVNYYAGDESLVDDLILSFSFDDKVGNEHRDIPKKKEEKKEPLKIDYLEI